MAREVIRIEGLEGVVRTLKALPSELVSKNGGPVRSALRKAAKVIQIEAQANVQRIVDQPNAHDLPTESIGLLKKSILVARGKKPPGGNGETQLVKIKRGARYPEKFQDKRESVTAAKVGRLLETGSEKRPPMPWLRPAFDAKKVEAVQVFVSDLKAKLAILVAKVARANGAKF